MPSLHLHYPSCKSLASLPLCFILPHKTIQTRTISTISTSLFVKNPNFCSISISKSPELLFLFEKSSILSTHVVFCSSNGEISNTHVSEMPEIEESEELELLGKPLPLPQNTNGSASEVVSETTKPEKDEVLAPFLKFFSGKDNTVEQVKEDSELEVNDEKVKKEEEVSLNKKVKVEYYDPKPGDFVVGVVVSGNDHKLDLNIGANLLGTMLTKEVLPLYDKELPYLLCDFEKDAEEFMVRGRAGIVFDNDAVGGQPVPGRSVVETGTILFAEVLGRTLSGRPLLSTRRLFRRVAWHRVRQIKQYNEPIEVRITEWNTGGLLTRIEGLRAFLPKAELMNKANNFTDLKENVGRQIYVRISRIDEASNDLILSEREAWEMMNLREGTLLEGTVRKVFPYGAQVRLGDTNRSGLLHISNITRSRVKSVSDLLSVGEKVKVLVVKSAFPDKISLSIADLESEPGLFVSNKKSRKYFPRLKRWPRSTSKRYQPPVS
ncbi:hypothetical protein AQUCO_11400013v1 [Aquilegia coerulea]|uniref:S1 motif domain-containing protein n=1 Tax=Aquilegia coerulea TaxID=218851 RepID=A0A2G5C2D6_AQUCA|nr:hypothetical protein AQUCO_11400013v1 [Aquilegia coerulea]